jgi:putative Holliday junction resolvase
VAIRRPRPQTVKRSENRSPRNGGSASRYTGGVTTTPNQPAPAGRQAILAIDYGRARLGLAIADGEAQIAQPLGTLERVNRNEDMRRLRELASERGVKQVIVGLPLRLDGTRGEMAEEAERFARRVQKQVGVPVEMVDERLTSWEAERLLEETRGRVLREEKQTRQGNFRKPAAKIGIDAMAAAVILKEYLQRPPAEEEPGRTK